MPDARSKAWMIMLLDSEVWIIADTYMFLLLIRSWELKLPMVSVDQSFLPDSGSMACILPFERGRRIV